MKRFIDGLDRSQTSLLPECIDDYVDDDNPVRAIDAFADMLDLAALGFDVKPEATSRPGSHPPTMLKPYLYGYLNQRSRRTGWSASALARVKTLRRCTAPTLVGSVHKAAVHPGFELEAACGATIRASNPMHLRASERALKLII